MTNDERKEIIRKLLKEGKRLPEIQNFLIKEKNDSITYMELRLLVAELDVQLPAERSSKFTDPVTPPTVTPKPAVPASAKGAAAAPAAPFGGGQTTVSIDAVVRAGAALSGKVSFGSGAKAEWMLDTYGRVGLDPLPGSSKATPQDLQDFQTELRRIIQEAQGSF